MSAAALSSTICFLLPAAADPQESVTAGREALDGWWAYPWYDPATDGLRRVEVPKPRDWSWLKDWMPDLGDWFRNLWPSWAGWPDTMLGWIAWSVLILALGAVGYLLIRAYLSRETRSAKSGDGEKESEQEDTDRIEALPMPVTSGRSDLLGEARRHYQQGNYGQAIVYLFSFQLVQLDKQQIIRLTKGKTNRQYLREVGPQASLRQLVEQTMVAFEDVFFGNCTLDRARFESCWARLDEFQSLAGEAAG